jgi:hypothetical protein
MATHYAAGMPESAAVRVGRPRERSQNIGSVGQFELVELTAITPVSGFRTHFLVA